MRLFEIERAPVVKLTDQYFKYRLEDLTPDRGELIGSESGLNFYFFNITDVPSYKSPYAMIVGFIEKNPIVMIQGKQSVLNGNKVFYITLTAVKTRFQGKGYGLTSYKVAIKQANIILVSTEGQSDGARKMWLSLSKDPEVLVYAYNKKTGESEILGRKGTIQQNIKQKKQKELVGSDMDLYQEPQTSYDNNICLVAKKA